MFHRGGSAHGQAYGAMPAGANVPCRGDGRLWQRSPRGRGALGRYSGGRRGAAEGGGPHALTLHYRRSERHQRVQTGKSSAKRDVRRHAAQYGSPVGDPRWAPLQTADSRWCCSLYLRGMSAKRTLHHEPVHVAAVLRTFCEQRSAAGTLCTRHDQRVPSGQLVA